MKPRGVNRVVIAVRDLDKAVRLYSELLGATFHDAGAAAKELGVRAALSWDAGIELVEPLPGRNTPIARSIEKYGEGLKMVVFSIDNVDEVRAKAEEMGIGVTLTIEFTKDQLRDNFSGRFTKYKEYVLNPADTCGAALITGQFEP